MKGRESSFKCSCIGHIENLEDLNTGEPSEFKLKDKLFGSEKIPPGFDIFRNRTRQRSRVPFVTFGVCRSFYFESEDFLKVPEFEALLVG